MTRASLIVWIRLGLWPWLVPSPVSAAVPDRYAGAQAATWGMDRGLPHTAVESLLQARDGFLWVGTREGLARFDGARFVVFDGTTEGFTSDACVDLAEDGSRGIWVATKKGAYRYASGRFTRFTTVDGLPADSVRQLHPLPDVGMGLATSGGLAIREGDRFRSIPFTVTNVEPDFHRVVTRNAESLLRARDARIWVGGPDGLSLLDPVTESRSRVWPRVSASENSARALVRAIVESGDGSLWFGTDDELVRCRDGVFTEFPFPPAYGDKRLRRLRTDGPNDLWIVRAGVLYRFASDTETLTPFDRPPGLSNRFVTDMLVDSEGNLWVGTRFGGLVQVRPMRAHTLTMSEGLPHNAVRSVTPARGGGVWVATAGGVARVVEGRAKPPEIEGLRPTRGSLLALEDGEGRLWLTDEQGTGGCYERKGDGYVLRAGTVHCGGAAAAHADSAGRVWFGFEDRVVCSIGEPGQLTDLSRFDPEVSTDWAEWWIHGSSGTAFRRGFAMFDLRGRDWTYQGSLVRRGRHPDEPFPAPFVEASPVGLEATPSVSGVRCFAEEPDGTLWMVAVDGSLLRLRHRRVESLGAAGNTSRVPFASLHRDNLGCLWSGSDRGLELLRDGRRHRFGKADGLPDESIHQIQSDARDHLWLATGRGLLRLARADLLRRADGGGGSPLLEGLLLDESDGMLTGDTSTTSQPGSCRTADGKLWFATPQGLVVVDPDAVRKDEKPPPIHVGEIRTAETRVVAGSDPIRLPAGSGKRIEIDYLALGFAAPEKIRFRYRLVGNDERWTDADARRIAYFTNLRPGAYRFEVLARNRDGVWCAEPAVARFAIRPGWHESRLVAAASGFSVLVAIVALHRMRLRATRAKERQTIARALHDQLAGKLAALVKAAEAVPDDPPTHDEKTLESPTRAGAVVELARSALATLRRTIALGLPASGRLPALVHAIVQHAEETCIPLRLSLRLDVPIEVPDRVVPYRVREEVLLVASEAINNVIKHAEAARVVVRMRFDDALLRLEIEDDGRGIPDALERESEGGLRHMRERAVQIGARFTLTPSDGGGTLVRLVVPHP